MATVIAPMLTKKSDDAPAAPAARFACTHVVNTAYVVETMAKRYVYQYGPEVAAAFIARIEVVRGNAAPKGEVFHHVSKGFGE